MPSILVIYNPVAGRNRVRDLWPQVSQALTDAGVSFDAVSTRAPNEATHIARSAVGTYTAVVGVGGDGTLSEIANGLLQVAEDESQTIPLALIPLGNGDDFAKALPPQAPIGGASYDWRAAVQKIATGRSRLYDVGRIIGDASGSNRDAHPRYFLNVVDVGFGAHTVQNFSSVPKFLSGYPAYLAAVLKTMIDYPSIQLRIQIDDAPAFEQSTTMTAIGNGRCFGGGFWVCPEAVPDDGLLDVMIAQQVNRRTIVSLIPKIQRGTHVKDPLVTMRRARRVALESDTPFLVEADGEMPLAPTRRLVIDLLTRKLSLIV